MKSDQRYKLGVQKLCKYCENERHKKYREAKKKEEWKEKEKQRHKYNQEHKEEIKERSKKFRDEQKKEFFACEICEILIKNHLVHEKSEYHQKKLNNGGRMKRKRKWQSISNQNY